MAFGCAPKIQEIDYSKYVWPSTPPTKFRLVKSIESDLDVRPRTTSEMLFGSEARWFLGKPHGVAVDKYDNIYVSDTLRADVSIINLKKGTISSLFNPYGWKTPMHIDVDNEHGLVAVADATIGKVSVFDTKSGSIKYQVGTGILSRPTGVAFNPKNERLYVCDGKEHSVFVFSIDGQYISKVAPPGSAEGSVHFPAAMAVDDAGNLYVVDTMNFRYQVFDPDGNFLRSVGEHGDRPGMFARPKGIAVSDDGYIFVTDAAFGNFQVFDKAGTVLIYVGFTGKGLGMFRIPQGIFVDHNDMVYVIDSINSRLQIFQYYSERYKEKLAAEEAAMAPAKADTKADDKASVDKSEAGKDESGEDKAEEADTTEATSNEEDIPQ